MGFLPFNKIKTFCLLVLFLLGFCFFYSQPFFKPLQPQQKKTFMSLPQIKDKIIKPVFLNEKLENINTIYYQSLSPLQQEQKGEMTIFNVFLGENTGMKEACGWLKYRFPQKQFHHHFSYALYNSEEENKKVAFDFRIQAPPPNFVLAYFEGGRREGKNNFFTFEQLKEIGHGASHLYLFWSCNQPYTPQPLPFRPENYHLEIIYDKGTNFGGPSYLAIDKIVIKDIQKKQIVGVYPINHKIEEPFVIFNYDFELRFPFYNYEEEGILWSTNRIKSLKKIDLYEKKTGQTKTLYYDVD